MYGLSLLICDTVSEVICRVTWIEGPLTEIGVYDTNLKTLVYMTALQAVGRGHSFAFTALHIT